MGDILSGGKIDESTSGPVPPKVDDRRTDILGEQKDKQDKNAMGGTQFSPRAQPLPPIPEATLVVPQLPSFYPSAPSFSSEASIDTRETARQAVIDVLKNVTINGQGPSIDGSSIYFNLPQLTKINEISFFQPTAYQQAAMPQFHAAQPQQSIFAIQQNQPTNEITSITLEPPKRIEESNKPPTADFGISKNLDEVQPERENKAYTPNLGSPKDLDTDQSKRESRLYAPDFGAPKDLDADQPKSESRLYAPDFGAPKDLDKDQTEREIRIHAPDFGASKDLDKYQPEPESKIRSTDFGSSDFNEKSDSAKAYRAAEQRREDRNQQDPNFDRESRIRQQGETPKEFKDRQEELRGEKEIQIAAINGNLKAALASGMIPVSLTRADGAKSILAFINSSFVGVTEGATAGERLTSLPNESSYFKITTSDPPCTGGFGIYTKNKGNETEVWIYSGTIDGRLPNGFDEIDGKFLSSSGASVVYAEVQIDPNSGEVTYSNIKTGTTMPTNSSKTKAYYELGYFEYDGETPSIVNYGCGSIRAAICKEWYATKPPFYSLRLER